MNSEPDFIAAIAANPGDELLYQAFGDWLEEQGDLRADWVRSPVVRKWMGDKFISPIPAIINRIKSEKKVLAVRPASAAIGAALVPELITLLSHESMYVRLQAVWCLRKIGKAAKDAVPALLERLKDDYYAVREQAGKALTTIGSVQGADSANLRATLTDSNSPVRHEALRLLEKMGEASSTARDFVEQLEDNDRAVWRAALRGLEMLRDPVSVAPLCRMLTTYSGEKHEAALEVLLSLGHLDPPTAVTPLRGVLANPTPRFRGMAANALGRLGKAAAEAIDDLLLLLHNDADENFANAADALGRIAAGDARVLAAFHAAACRDQGRFASSAAQAMAHWPSLPVEFAEMLLNVALSNEQDNGNPVLPAFSRLESLTPGILALLRRTLARITRPSNEFYYATCAAEVLAKLGEQAVEAVPELVIAARVGNDAAARALARMGDAGIVALVELLDADSEEVRTTAVNGLRAAGPCAAIAVAQLREFMQTTKNEWRRRSAIATLATIGPAASEAIPELIAFLKSDPDTANEAREALVTFRSLLIPHVPALAALAKSKSSARLAAVRVLSEVACYSNEFLPPLRLALRDNTAAGAEIRKYAAKCVGELRDDDSVPALESLLNDSDEGVRREACVALGQIGVKSTALHTCLRDSDEGVRARAAEALGIIADKNAATALIRATKDDNARVRREAVEALGRLKSDDQAILLALRVAEADADRHVRTQAVAALKKIERTAKR